MLFYSAITFAFCLFLGCTSGDQIRKEKTDDKNEVAQESKATNSELDKLIRLAKSEKSSQRISGLTKIGKLYPSLKGDDQKLAADTLISSVADRLSLVVSAGKIQLEANAVSINGYLKPYLESDKSYNYVKGCEAIKAIGSPARVWIEYLEKNLDNDDKMFHLGSLHALAHLDGKDVLPLLDKVIKHIDSKDFNVQLSACKVIANIGHDANRAGPKLVELLENGIASSRSWASIALGAIGPHKDYDVVELLAERLDRFYLVDRQRALIGLAYLGKDAEAALPKIEILMSNPEKSVQHTAAKTYWQITGDSKKAVETLIPLAATMNHGIEAMDVLGEMGGDAREAVPQLIKQLKAEEAPYREAAIYALAGIGQDALDAIDALKSMKNDEDELIREAALMAIKKIQNDQSKPVTEKSSK